VETCQCMCVCRMHTTGTTRYEARFPHSWGVRCHVGKAITTLSPPLVRLSTRRHTACRCEVADGKACACAWRAYREMRYKGKDGGGGVAPR